MTTYRILPDGRRRGLPDGNVRAVGVAGDIGTVIQAVPLTVVFDLAAQVSPGTPVVIEPSPFVMAFNVEANISYTTAETIYPQPFVAEFTMTASAYRTGEPPITAELECNFFQNARGIYGITAPRFERVFKRWYAAEADGWASLDKKSLDQAVDAGDKADANASAIIVTNTRVDLVDGRVTAVANRTTVLESRVTDTENDISGQATAISGLQTTVTSQGGQISANASAITAVSAQVTTLDGEVVLIADATEVLRVDVDSVTNTANATWGVYLDVNGYISGVQSVNDGVTSQFNIRADVFRLINSAASGLESRDGWLRAYNGASQVIIGNGFGASGNLMFYAGPNVGVAAASKSNATIWFDQSGNAYFGGTLSAGIWKNAAQSTQLGMGANVSTGTFASMGNQRTVVCSFSLEHSGNRVGNNAGTSPLGVTVNLYRNGSLVQSFPITGNYTGVYEPELDRTRYTCNFGGSFTHTDNTGGTSCEYSLTLSSQVGTWPRTDFNVTTGGPTQRLSVISTEEP